MSEPEKPNRPLSEISHLFLSEMRDRAAGGAPRPVRTPPGKKAPAASTPPGQPLRRDLTIDLTPEEFALVFGEGPAAVEEEPATPPVCAVIASHHNGKQVDRVRQYARSLAAMGQRIGLIEIDVSEFRLTRFDADGEPSCELPCQSDCADVKAMTDAITEMGLELDAWLLLACNPRLPEARALLREAAAWTILTTCDHDGVVSSYRTLKGLVELGRPALSVAVLDAASPREAQLVHRKLAGVCAQFLQWPVETWHDISPATNVAEHLAMFCRPMQDKSQLATAGHWQVVSNLLESSRPSTTVAEIQRPAEAPPRQPQPLADIPMAPIAGPESATPSRPPNQAPASPASPMQAVPMQAVPAEPFAAPASFPMASEPRIAAGSAFDEDEVIDLPGNEMTPDAVLAAIVTSACGALAECPIRPPACPESRLAVTRDRRLVLLAAAQRGLSDVAQIARAYQWLGENRQLIAMALTQFAIDAHALPHLRLYVNQADANAQVLQAMIPPGSVTIQTYRRIKWGSRAGLLVQAA